MNLNDFEPDEEDEEDEEELEEEDVAVCAQCGAVLDPSCDWCYECGYEN